MLESSRRFACLAALLATGSAPGQADAAAAPAALPTNAAGTELEQ